jgi:hypothetical protein
VQPVEGRQEQTATNALHVTNIPLETKRSSMGFFRKATKIGTLGLFPIHYHNKREKTNINLKKNRKVQEAQLEEMRKANDLAQRSQEKEK